MVFILKLKGFYYVYNLGIISEGDEIVVMCWNYLLILSRDVLEGWRFVGYKVVVVFVM